MDREHRREWERKYYARNRDKLREKSRRFLERNRERETKRRKSHYLENRDAILDRSKERYRQNKVRKLALAKLWRKANPEKMRQYSKTWQERNPRRHLERARIHSHKRRTLSRSGCCDVQSINLISQLIRSAVKMKCAICRKNMKSNDRSIDHVIPLSKGGSGDIGNLQVVHRKCNAQKYAKMPHELDGQMQMHLVGRVA